MTTKSARDWRILGISNKLGSDMTGWSAKLSIFLPGLHGGGAEKMMLDLASEFASLGHDVEISVAREEGAFTDRVPEAVSLVNLAAPEPPGFALLGALPGLVRYLRRRRPDVVLSALNRANIVAILATKLSNVDTRVVVSERNHLSTYLEHARFRERVVLPRLIGRVYPSADEIVAISSGVGDDLATTVGLDRERVTVIHNPAMTPEVERLATEPPSHPWLRTKETPVIVGVGSLTVQKDFETLIGAFNQLRDRQEVRLVIFGEGDRRESLEETVQNRGLSEVVDLPGFVDNPYAEMRAADVFALSSKWEGFGNVIVEALGCGCPVVSTDCPSGPSEILGNGEYGRLVPVGDEGALAGALAETMDSPPPPEHLQRRAESFSVELVGREYLDVLLSD